MVVVGLAVLGVVGCSVTVPGTPAPARDVPVADLPFADAARMFAEQMAIFRTWDVCAALDVAAAERLTGAVAFAVRPVRGFDGCEVALEVAGTELFSYVSVEVGAVVPGPGPDAEVEGRRFPEIAPADRAEDRAECGYARPVAAGWGVLVRGEVVDDPAASCTLAQAYLADTLSRIDAPPRRAAAGTDPAFAVGEQDPCAVLATLVPDATDVTVTGPRRCGAGEIEVVFGLHQFETDVAGIATNTPGGRLESVDEETAGCTVTRQASDTTLLAPSLPYLHRETLAVTAGDCATARAHVARIEPTLPGPATPATGALALGSLEGFPVADDVGAPFDPCATVGWSAFPVDVRPAGIDPRPFPSPSDPLHRVGCDYSSDAVASVLSWGPARGAYSVDPAVRPGVATQFGGRAGLEDRTAQGEAPLCLSTMQLSNGLASIITLARDTQADLCAINRAVLEALAPLVP